MNMAVGTGLFCAGFALCYDSIVNGAWPGLILVGVPLMAAGAWKVMP